jgi:hypothetical protein
MTAPAHAKRWLRIAAAAFTGILAASTLILAPMAASASSSQTWTGLGDGSSWGDPQNWASHSVPQNGDSVTIAPTPTQARPVVSQVPGGTQLQDLTLTDTSLSGGDITVMGNFSWSVSTWFNALATPLTVQGDASFSGAGEQDSQAPMTFEGNTDIAGPGLLSIQDSGPAITNSGTLTIEPGAVVRADACCTSPDQFINTGTVAVPASASGTATLGFMDFNDQGSISVGAGSLLDVPGGPGEFSTGSGLSGGGTLQFDQGAAITLGAKMPISAASTLVLTGNAEFFGPGSFTGGGKFSWTGGTIDGNLDVAKTIHTTLSGTAKKILMSPGSPPALLAFHGPTTVQGSGPLEAFQANISTSGTFTIKPGAAVDASACCVSPDEFLNTGTLTVPASGSGTAHLDWLNFNDQGAVSVGTGSTLRMTVGPGEFSPGAGISGGGTLEFDQNASMTLASNLSIGAATTMLQTGGATFAGPGSFTGTGSYRWSGGTINGNLNVAATIGTTISGTATKTITSPTTTPTALTLHGSTTVQGSGEVELTGTTTLNNLGTLTMQAGTTVGGSVCCVAPDHFTNGGTLNVAAGTKTATATNLAFSNSGTVKITGGTLFVNSVSYQQTAGSTQLAGGSLSAAQQINITGGTLSGFGAITGSVHNAGTVSPSTTGGVLKISGTYQQTSAGVLSSVITGTSPGTKFGQLSVGGQATLAGTLKVSTGNGFTPSHGESFSVLLYHCRSGKFSTTSGSPAYTVTYAATAAKAVYP